MNKQLRFIIFLLFVIGTGIHSSTAQTTFGSEDELKQQATKLFDDDEFEDAYPLYSQLVSLYPKDANYNYRLGVCMLYASDDKEKPIPFLEYAAKSPQVDKEVFFYLAKAYHLNYRFDDAIKEYLEYEKVASSAKADKLQVDRQIEMCRNGKKLLRNITDLVVLDKKELSRADFYRAYDISDIGGKLLAKPDEDAFKTSLDKKKKEKSIIYLASNNNQVYFSSYGDDLSHGKDIYVIRKLPNGEWSKPQTLGYPVNTEYDEDYPFLHPNGKVLYFCSKGHNSMGGYDIFKTTLNEETNTWNKPVNLDFPINTPDDDILYVTNEDEKEAFFSSARASKTGKTAVYHINVERKPIEVAIIKGAVIRNRENQAIDVKITVKDLADNVILGIYNSKAETGGYLINLPNGGKFMYTVEAAGFSTQSDVVILPTQYEFKPLKQEITYELGTDKLIIKNMFDEPVDDQSYLQVISYLKEKSRLDAGINNDASQPLAAKTTTGDDATQSTATPFSTEDGISKTSTRPKDNPATPGNDAISKTPADKTAVAKTNAENKTTTPASLSNNDIVKIAYDDAKDAEKEAKDLQEQADIALNIANEKNELAQNKTKEATQLMSDANSMTDNVKKQTVIDEAKQAREEEAELNRETVAAFNIAKKLGLKAASKQEEADLSMQYAKDLEAAVKSKNSTEAMAKLEDQEKKLEALSEQNGNAEPDNITAGLKMDASNKKRELDKVTQASDDIKQEIRDNETLIAQLQSDAEKTKKEDLKKGLLDQIAGLKADNEQNQKDLEQNEQKVAQVKKEYNGIKNEIDLVNNVVDKSKTGTNEAAAASVATIDKTKLEAQVNEINSNKAEDDAVLIASVKTNGNNSAAKTNETKSGDAAIADNTQTSTTDAADNSKTKSTDAAATGDNTQSTTGNSVTPAVDYAKQYANELASADGITNELERENKKAELYKNWSAAISDELTQKKQAVKTEKDKAKKKELTDGIAVLEKELKEKQADEKTAVASAAKLKQEEAIAATSPDNTTKTTDAATNPDNSQTTADNTQAVTDNTKTADNTQATPDNTKNTDNAVASTAAAELAAINEKYQGRLADANIITNELEKENTKTEVFKDWSDAINALVLKQKQEMSASKDPEVKATLATQIVNAQKQAEDKNTMAVASQEQVAVLKKQQGVAATAADKTNPDNVQAADDNTKTADIAKTGIADNTTKTTDAGSAATPDNSTTTDAVKTNPGNTTAGTDVATVATAQQLDNAIAEADKATNEHDKEIKKQQAYTDYISAENAQLQEKQSALKTEKDKDRKKELTQDIASIRQEIGQKQTMLDDANAKIKALDEQAALAADNSTDATTDNAKTNPAAVAINYTNPVAADEAKQAAAAQKESDDLNAKANDMKTEAATKTKQPEKDALFAQAADLEKQADEKKIKATQLSGSANIYEYNANKNALEQYAAAPGGNKSSDEISMAEMMKDESKIYFDKAQKSNELAATVSSDEDKLAALEDANANEKIALEKQQKATELYKKNNPGFVVKAVVADVAVNEAKSANNTTTPDNTKTKSRDAADNTTSSKTTDVAVNNKTKSSPDNTASAPDNATTKSTDAAANTAAKTSDAATTETQSTPDNTAATADNTKSTDNAIASLGSINEKYQAKLAEANAITNELEKENIKTEVFKDWSDAINALVLKQKQEMSASKDPGVKADLATQIVEAQKQAEEKNTMAAASREQVTALKQQQVIADNSAAKATGDNLNTKSADVAKSNDEGDHTKIKSADAATNEIKSGQEDAGLAENTDTKTSVDNTTVPDNTNTKSSDAATNTTKSTPDNTTLADDTKTKPGVENAATPDNTTTKSTDAATALKSNTDNVQANDAAKTVLAPTERFERTSEPAYSASRPIPVNEKLPEGLVFKVQIGAFRNPISPEQFSGMKPITAETTSQGFTRYTAGLFTKFATADKVKTEIRGLGYKDAFVVAFLNGKRISISEALGMSGETNATPVAANTATTADKTIDGSQTTDAAANKAAQTTAVNAAVNSADVAPSENIAAVNGLFYTVQVGVYSQPITSAKLHNIQPLYTEKTPNGYIRYNTGIYNNMARANEAKNIAVGAGVKDAFVTAYYQGKRISMAEAATLETQGSGVFSTAPGMNNLPTVNGITKQAASTPVSNTPAPVINAPKETAPKPKAVPAETITPAGTTPEPEVENNDPPAKTRPAETSVTTEQTPAVTTDQTPPVNTELKNTVAQNNTMPVEPGVVFKVQIGAFKDEVPLDIANQFLKIANKGIKNYKDENGLTIYTVGNFKTYEEASQLRAEIAVVVKDAFIVAYNDGKKVSIDEAKSLLNK